MAGRGVHNGAHFLLRYRNCGVPTRLYCDIRLQRAGFMHRFSSSTKNVLVLCGKQITIILPQGFVMKKLTKLFLRELYGLNVVLIFHTLSVQHPVRCMQGRSERRKLRHSHKTRYTNTSINIQFPVNKEMNFQEIS